MRKLLLPLMLLLSHSANSIGFLSNPPLVTPSNTVTLSNKSLDHLRGTGTPSVSVGTGAGTGGSASLVGNDSFMTVTVLTGTLPTAGGTVATVTYGSAFSRTPTITMTPCNSQVVASSTTRYYVNPIDASNFSIITSGASTGSATYIFCFVSGE